MGKESDLMIAVKDGNAQHIRKLLHKYRKSNKNNSSKKSTVNVPDVDGFTPLHHAALAGDVDIVMAIVEMEGDPNGRDKQGMTPLHLSAWAGKDGSVKALLESRALPNLLSLNSDTALHLASQHGYATSVKLLLDAHADGSFRNVNLETPLDLACQFGHTAVVKQLLTSEKVISLLTSPNPDSRYKSPLHLASKSGHDDIVHLLLQAGALVNEVRPEGSALHQAALYGKTDVVRLLLSVGADVHKNNSYGIIPLELVNTFTTSRAGLEIKQMLREAAGERIQYAQAVSDYSNKYDDTCLSFKCNDSIAVIEQNENGRWRGYCVGCESEKVGYFPAMTVHLLNQPRMNQSVSSMGSAASSIDSTDNRSSCSSSLSPEKRNEPGSPISQPVGVVPIGSFEVVTLAQSIPDSHAPPKQTANGALPPRMGSFKKTVRQQQSLHQPQRKQPPQPPQRQLPPQSPMSQQRKHTPPSQLPHHQIVPPPLQSTASKVNVEQLKQQQQIHVPPRTVHRSQSEHNSIQKELQSYITLQQPQLPIKTIYRSQSEHPSDQRSIDNRCHTLGRHSTKNYSIQQQQPEQFRTRTSSTGTSKHELAKALKQVIINRPKNNSSSSDRSSIEISQYTRGTKTISLNNCEDASRSNVINESQTKVLKPILMKSKSQDSNANNRIILRSAQNNVDSKNVKFLTPEMKHKLKVNQGYEDMSLEVEIDSPPELPLKRSLTMPANFIRKSNSNELITESKEKTDLHFKMPSTKQTNNAVLYENQDIRLEGSQHEGIQSPLEHKSPKNELLDWLTEHKLTCYYDNFVLHGFDMVSMQAVTPEDLNIINITKAGHRKKLLSEIAKLPLSDKLPNQKLHNVGSWLGQLNLRQYEPNFVEGGFDDIDFIKDLDKNDLEMIDIKKKGHQKKLLLAVHTLNDLEMTAILDKAVADSPVKRIPSLHNRNHIQPEIHEFFPTIPNYNMALSPRDDLPPPSGQEHIDLSPKHFRPPIPNKPSDTLPPPVASKPIDNKLSVPVAPKPNKNNSAPIPACKPLGGPAPKPKPKSSVKPVNSVNGITANLGSVSMKPPGEIQGDQEEIVTSSKSRDFFKQQELNSSDENIVVRRQSSSSNEQINRTTPPTTIQHNNHSSAFNKAPVPAPAPKPTDKAPPVAAKKLPAPVPPKRSCSVKSEPVPTTLPTEIVNDITPHSEVASPPLADVLPPPPEVSPPLDETTLTFSPPIPDFTPQPPTTTENIPQPIETPASPDVNFSPPPPLDVSLSPSFNECNIPPPLDDTPPTPPAPLFDENVTIELSPATPVKTVEPETEFKDNFAETDELMTDLMADIDDFSSQLDAMF